MPLSNEFKKSGSDNPEPVNETEASPMKVAENLASLMSDDKSRAKFVDSLRYNKPERWSAKSNAPYYRRVYAEAFKKVIDRMMINKNDQMYFYKDFPSTNPDSLSQKISQARNYLLDKMDPDLKYEKFLECVQIIKKRSVGIRLTIRHDLLEDAIAHNDFMPKEIITDAADWKSRFEDYLINGQIGVPLEVTGVALSAEQIEDLELQLAPFAASLVYSIRPDRIKIVKV